MSDIRGLDYVKASKPIPMDVMRNRPVAMALELAKYNIQINAIAPGYTWSEAMKKLDEKTLSGMAGAAPDGRMGTPLEVGALAVFLASDAANHISGEIITIDSGHSLGID
jgi:NAD(P)-dependent dehydrogenase (short-subunit alcohol dehydrogenase family)